MRPSKAIEHIANTLNIDDSYDISEIEGGLFNRVYSINKGSISNYLKLFLGEAKSKNFPPLPTSAQDRAKVAITCHQIALSSARKTSQINIPDILYHDYKKSFIYMSGVPGNPLYERLLKQSCLETDIICGEKVTAWLYQLHHYNDSIIRESIYESSVLFKEFKLKLQYFDLIESLPYDLQSLARSFAISLSQCNDCILHGDINSRNILITADNQVSVIDFEQSQIGDPMYDLAYIISEYIIKAVHLKKDPETAINPLVSSYHRAQTRGYEKCKTDNRKLRVHLAFQVIYRLTGPSKEVWSSHLSNRTIESLKKWSVTELYNRL